MVEKEFSSYLDDFLLDMITNAGEVFYHLDSHQRPRKGTTTAKKV